MRMWMVDPKLLCQQHLLGEHVELHMSCGSINKNISMLGYIKGGLLEIHNIRSRHEALVAEMAARGLKHKSPLPEYPSVRAGHVDKAANLKELARRCPECAKRQQMFQKDVA